MTGGRRHRSARLSTPVLGVVAALVIAASLSLVAGDALAQAPAPAPPDSSSVLQPTPPAPPVVAPDSVSSPLIEVNAGDGKLVPALKVLLLLAAMTFIPAILLGMTSFTRIIVVLGLLRQAVGVMQLPPNRVLVALALFLTLFTMKPVFEQIYDVSIAPYDAGALTELEALDAALTPLKEFMLAHTREEDLLLFIDMAQEARPSSAADVSTVSLIPAFMLSELKTAFQIGALLFLPFLVIDIVVASILMSMGMMMLPPATISLPLKIIVFVMVDGWGLVAESVVTGVWGA